MEKHEIVKIRREPVRRSLRVLSKKTLTPKMLRITLASEELRSFDSASPDDHIKIFLPASDGERIARDFTPRAWDRTLGTLTIDFALHAHGPATEWARDAKTGDCLEIGGPRGSTVVPDDFEWYLMIGDSSALPSFGRRLEELREGVSTYVFAEVANDEERQRFTTASALEVRWLYAEASIKESIAAFLAMLKQFELPEGDGCIWIAGEASVARELYRYLVDERSHPKEWIKAASYWTQTDVD